MGFMELFQLLFDKNILLYTTHEMSLIHKMLLAAKKNLCWPVVSCKVGYIVCTIPPIVSLLLFSY